MHYGSLGGREERDTRENLGDTKIKDINKNLFFKNKIISEGKEELESSKSQN